jgi:hypothetical protein
MWWSKPKIDRVAQNRDQPESAGRLPPTGPPPRVFMGGRRCLTLLALFLLAGGKAQKPGKVETATVNCIKHHVTVRGKSDKNPVPDTEENRASGQDAFVS